MPQASPEALAQRAACRLEDVRRQRPRVHCLTNIVAATFTANVLLALGAVPSMTSSPEEVAGFVDGADALLVNLGTLDAGRRTAIDAALDAAQARGLPWVLDPVLVERSPQRLAFAEQLLAREPRVLRANVAEAAALSGAGRSAATVLAITGETDRIEGGGGVVSVTNGHSLMARVTAMGCAAGAAMAVFLAVEEDAAFAAAAALAVFGVAGQIAGSAARGPGSFVPLFLDALHSLDAATLAAHARIAA